MQRAVIVLIGREYAILKFSVGRGPVSLLYRGTVRDSALMWEIPAPGVPSARAIIGPPNLVGSTCAVWPVNVA